MIQDFMAGSLFDCYQASTIEFEPPKTDRNQRFIHITQHRTDKREEDRLGMGREGLGLRGRPFVRNCFITHGQSVASQPYMCRILQPLLMTSPAPYPLNA